MKQGTGVVGELCKDVFIPKMVKVHQKFDLSYIKPEDIPGVVRAQLDRDIMLRKKVLNRSYSRLWAVMAVLHRKDRPRSSMAMALWKTM